MVYEQTANGLIVPANTVAHSHPLPPSANNDGLVNVVSGLGTAKAKTSHNRFQYDLLNDFLELDAAYQSNWIVRNICDVPAEDMTRDWRTIKSKDGEQVQREEERLGLRLACQNAIRWARLFGGAGILMLTGQDLSKPLDINKVKKGDLKRLLVFDRWELSSLTLNTWDVLSENYLQPEFYTLQGGHQSVHWSHIARVNGAPLSRRQIAQTHGWGDSEVRKCFQDIKDAVSAKGGIAELMQEANVDVITREGLADELSTDQDEKITQRYAMFSQMKSIFQLALLDGDENYDRKTLNMSGLAPAFESLMIWLSGATGMPMTKLFGTAAKGLNATGEGDERSHNKRMASLQGSQLQPAVQVIDQVMVRSALGTYPDDYSFEWNPMSEVDDEKVANAEAKRAETDMKYLEAGVVQVSQVQRNLQANEQYQFDDDQIEQLEASEEPGLFNSMTGNQEETYFNTPGSSNDEAASLGFASVKPLKSDAEAIHNHLKDLGISGLINPSDLHVTLMYSPNSTIHGTAKPSVTYRAKLVGDPKIFGKGKWRAIVIEVDSSELHARHSELRSMGGKPTYSDYRPHLSLKYNPSDEDLELIKANPIPVNSLLLSGERFEPCK